VVAGSREVSKSNVGAARTLVISHGMDKDTLLGEKAGECAYVREGSRISTRG
jgi:hypothetical protein